MITITENIEDKANNYKDWYKTMNTLVGEKFTSTPAFENSLCIGAKILIDSVNPVLPPGLSIPPASKITTDLLKGKTLEVKDVTISGNTRQIDLGIRSNRMGD